MCRGPLEKVRRKGFTLFEVSIGSISLSECSDSSQGWPDVPLNKGRFMCPPARGGSESGFTLIELSIVLVIIGLIVGGVVVGRSLIAAATVRAQISQIERYDAAVNTFRGKYNAIPGDMNIASATQFGFTVGTGCTGGQGTRDGNGLIDGGAAPNQYSQGGGETGLFWQDLSAAGLIDATIPNSGAAPMGCSGCPAIPIANLGEYFPPAKIADTTYLYVYEYQGSNWSGISRLNAVQACGNLDNPAGFIPVIQAYNIDKKIDDGLPESGNVQAMAAISQTAVGGAYDTWGNVDPLQCFDGNPGIVGGAYSINAGAGNNSDSPNCLLSFRFQ
jgi:prepilin-type N-terminal cleavage/methylation domain-containing protein